MTTIKEVSDLAGVSQATVSRVINGSDRVTESTRNRVRAAMKELGYQPNSAAQSLASNRSNCFGMVTSELLGPFYGPMMSAVENVLRKNNKHLIIASGHGSEAQERDAIEYLIGRQVDALILLTECVDSEYLTELNKRVPVFLINQHVDGLEDRNMWLDNEGGTYQATQYLINHGHTKIVHVGGQPYKQDANERVAGFKRAMSEAKLKVTKDHIVQTRFEFQGGVEGMEVLRKRGIDFTAVVAGNDEEAFGIMDWADRQGLRVPEDLSVIGFDDILTAHYVKPKLTTMRFPMFEMAETAAQAAIDAVYHKKPPIGGEFKLTLVERETVSKRN